LGFLDFFNRKGNSTRPNTRWVEIDDHGRFYHMLINYLSNFKNGFTFTNEDSYRLSKLLSELYNPIDLIADRVSSVEYFITDKNGVRLDKLPTTLARLIEKPNPFQKLSNLIYDIQFSELASGGSYVYPVVSGLLKQKTENISSIYCIEPDKVNIIYKSSIPAPFLVSNFAEFVDKVQIQHFSVNTLTPDKLKVFIDNRFNFADMSIESPLLAVTQNIQNLMVAYQARYNVYSSNGSAGLLARKQAQNSDMAEITPDGEMRQKMIDEMKSKDGIINGKNFIGISSIPIEFIKTLADIKDLQPFDECKADALAVLGVYNVSPFLTPLSTSTTFTNQHDAEVALWQNTIIPRINDTCRKLNEVFFLDENMRFSYSLDSVQCLQPSRAQEMESDIKELELHAKLQELGVESDILNKWKN